MSTWTNYFYPQTEAQGTGDTSWTTIGNADADDASYDYCDINNGDLSKQLLLTNFGLDGVGGVPAGAIIKGIEVSVEAYCETTNVTEDKFQLLYNGSLVGDDYDDTGYPDTSLSVHTEGGATDMWGTTLTADQLRSSLFGVCLQYQNDAVLIDRWVRVDYVRVRVAYDVIVYDSDVIANHIDEISKSNGPIAASKLGGLLIGG